MATAPALSIHPTAYVSPDARIHPSQRGTRIVIGAHTQIYDYVVIRAVGGSGDIVIGEHCYLNPHCVLYSGAGIRFGDYVLVGPGCAIVPSNHARSEIAKHGHLFPDQNRRVGIMHRDTGKNLTRAPFSKVNHKLNELIRIRNFLRGKNFSDLYFQFRKVTN